jgi:hypothetical protein
LRGAVQGTYVQDDGAVLQGNDLNLRASGVLLVQHQPGLIIAWLEDTATDPSTLLQTPIKLEPNTTQTMQLQGRKWAINADVSADSLLQLRSDKPLISKIDHAGLPQMIELHPNAMNYAVYLPKGGATFAFQSIGADQLSGELFIRTAAIESLQEGIGPETILGSGDTKLYRFHLKHAGDVGLGIQASSDVVSGILMNHNGTELDRGVILMPKLEPGDYVFAVSVPQTSPAVRVKPVLVGIEQRDTGPPVEVIQQYLQQAGRKLQQ